VLEEGLADLAPQERERLVRAVAESLLARR
jgi:hypothetical protein